MNEINGWIKYFYKQQTPHSEWNEKTLESTFLHFQKIVNIIIILNCSNKKQNKKTPNPDHIINA